MSLNSKLITPITGMQMQMQTKITDQLVKQTKRIKRISSQLCHKVEAALVGQLDEIVYAALKIEKIINGIGNGVGTGILLEGTGQNAGSDRVEHMDIQEGYDEGYYNDAIIKINSILGKFSRFEKKANILIHETNINRLKPSHKWEKLLSQQNSPQPNQKETVKNPINPQLPNKEKASKLKTNKLRKSNKISDLQEQQQEQDQQESIKSLDKQIQDLVQRIKQENRTNRNNNHNDYENDKDD